jgi:hypothetical protein
MYETWHKKTLPDLEASVARVTQDNAPEVTQWCGGDLIEEIDPFNQERQYGINVPTEMGRERASAGDYIFQLGGKGSFQVSKPNAFRTHWEPTIKE